MKCSFNVVLLAQLLVELFPILELFLAQIIVLKDVSVKKASLGVLMELVYLLLLVLQYAGKWKNSSYVALLVLPPALTTLHHGLVQLSV